MSTEGEEKVANALKITKLCPSGGPAHRPTTLESQASSYGVILSFIHSDAAIDPAERNVTAPERYVESWLNCIDCTQSTVAAERDGRAGSCTCRRSHALKAEMLTVSRLWNRWILSFVHISRSSLACLLISCDRQCIKIACEPCSDLLEILDSRGTPLCLSCKRRLYPLRRTCSLSVSFIVAVSALSTSFARIGVFAAGRGGLSQSAALVPADPLE